jgi:hypothetical protein
MLILALSCADQTVLDEYPWLLGANEASSHELGSGMGD